MDIAATLQFLAACAGLLICFKGMHHEGFKVGYEEGIKYGYLTALAEVCDGHATIDGRKVKFDEGFAHFYDKELGRFATEIDIDEFVCEDE